MNGAFIDMHMHSRYSDDGEFSPSELVRQCSDGGIKIMAVADHNCAKANAEAKKAALAAGITYIPAIEVDCTFQGVNFHVLGYGIDYESGDFADIENHVASQGLEASRQMLEATRRLGFPITKEDMERVARDSYWKDSWTGEMFAEVLLNKPEYAEHPLLLPYRSGGARGDNPYVNFYWDYYSQGKPCYAKVEYPGLEQAADIIHRNHGYAVLAHPGMNLKNHAGLLEPVIRAGMDGLEAFSSYHSPEQAAYFYSEARARQLFVTCGSDYHGKTKPSIRLGGHGCLISDEEMLGQIEKILAGL